MLGRCGVDLLPEPPRSGDTLCLEDTSPHLLALVTVLSLLALALRTEMWRVALQASGHQLPRVELHAANGGTLAVSLVNGYIAPAVKIWLLRRMRPADGPKIPKLIVVDLAAMLLELLLAAALVVVVAFFVDVPWWTPAVMLGIGALLLLVAFLTHRRWEHHPAIDGLNVVIHSYFRYRLLGLLAAVFLLQIVRTWLTFHAVGVDATLGDATLIFVLTGVLGALPTGLAAAPTTASLVVLGRSGVGPVAAAGVLTTVALFVGTALYLFLTGRLVLDPSMAVLEASVARPIFRQRPRPPTHPALWPLGWSC